MSGHVHTTFFQIYISLYQNVINTDGKIILSCYVAMILQMKDCQLHFQFDV